MKIISFLILAAMAGLISNPAFAQDKKPTETPKAEAPAAKSQASAKASRCKSGADERIIEIRDREGGGCQVVYTKNGQEEVKGEAEHQLDFCDQLRDRMTQNLQGAGFECS